jgi:hypothetical protein
MDTIFQALFSWQFLLFCLAIAAVLFVIRRVFEYLLETRQIHAKNSKLWKDLILPILPVVIGPAAAYLAHQYPYPGGLTSGAARVAFGLVAGLLYGLVYRVLKSMLGYRIKNPESAYNPYGSYTSYGGYSPYGAFTNPAVGTPDAPVSEEFEASVRDSIKKDQ